MGLQNYILRTFARHSPVRASSVQVCIFVGVLKNRKHLGMRKRFLDVFEGLCGMSLKNSRVMTSNQKLPCDRALETIHRLEPHHPKDSQPSAGSSILLADLDFRVMSLKEAGKLFSCPCFCFLPTLVVIIYRLGCCTSHCAKLEIGLSSFCPFLYSKHFKTPGLCNLLAHVNASIANEGTVK